MGKRQRYKPSRLPIEMTREELNRGKTVDTDSLLIDLRRGKTPQVQEFNMYQYPTAFELMLEVAKRETIYCNSTGHEVSAEKLFKAAEKAEVLVFYPTKEEKEGTKPIKAKSEETRIDCPYPVCSLELYQSGIRFSKDKPSQRLYNLLVIENQAEDMEEVYETDSIQSDVSISCVLGHASIFLGHLEREANPSEGVLKEIPGYACRCRYYYHSEQMRFQPIYCGAVDPRAWFQRVLA